MSLISAWLLTKSRFALANQRRVKGRGGLQAGGVSRQGGILWNLLQQI